MPNSAPGGSNEVVLTLASYNIHRCIGRDGRYDPARIIRVLRELNADVMALQEVETVFDRGQELLECLAEALGVTAVAGPTLFRDTGHYGNAVLSRLPIVGQAHLDLSLLGREPRGALEVRVQHQGLTLQVVATHLGLLARERRVQLQRLLECFNDADTRPAVLMGDLNTWLLRGRLRRRLQAYFGATTALATFPAALPMFALDRIWVRPRSALVALEVHKSEQARIASDHLPLKALTTY